MAVPSRIEQLCLDKGMKMTEQRRVIARVLSESSDHPHVEEVHRRANLVDPRISIATVYRTVRLFEEANIIERREFGDGRARYEEVDEKHHHHHLINLKTGEVIEFENAELETLKRKICHELGFEMVGDRLELFGVPLQPAQPVKPRK